MLIINKKKLIQSVILLTLLQTLSLNTLSHAWRGHRAHNMLNGKKGGANPINKTNKGRSSSKVARKAVTRGR